MFIDIPQSRGTAQRPPLGENQSEHTHRGESFFFFILYVSFYLGVIKFIAGEGSADLSLPTHEGGSLRSRDSCSHPEGLARQR